MEEICKTRDTVAVLRSKSSPRLARLWLPLSSAERPVTDLRQRRAGLCDVAQSREPLAADRLRGGACGGDDALRQEVEALLARQTPRVSLASSLMGTVAARREWRSRDVARGEAGWRRAGSLPVETGGMGDPMT
jgi:hypothetical protein